jgi:hypothetical protein
MAKKGYTDTDMGFENIFKEMEKLKSMCVKVGVTEDVGKKATKGGATIAQIASWNELGVMGPPESQHGDVDGGGWFIPPRPFVRGWADGKRELIDKTEEKLYKLVSEGKIKADEAIRLLGEFGQSGVKSYLRNGTFTENADSTIAKKGSGKAPLLDTRKNLLPNIHYQIIDKPIDMAGEQ